MVGLLQRRRFTIKHRSWACRGDPSPQHQIEGCPNYIHTGELQMTYKLNMEKELQPVPSHYECLPLLSTVQLPGEDHFTVEWEENL